MKHSIHLSETDEKALQKVLAAKPATNLSRIAARAIRDEYAQIARRTAFRKLMRAEGVELSEDDRAWAARTLDELDGPR